MVEGYTGQYLAHIEKDGRTQSLKKHSADVAGLCSKTAKPMKLSHMATLAGYLHDMGKATQEFQKYLRCSATQPDERRPTGQAHPAHAPVGARYVYERWMNGKDVTRRRTVQLLALCIYGHHAGLADCLINTGESPFLQGMQSIDPAQFDEARKAYEENVCPPDKLDELFEEACKEIKAFIPGEGSSWTYGFLARWLLSILVDADRWNSACFCHGTDSSDEKMAPPCWQALAQALENHLGSLPRTGSRLDKVREDISNLCLQAGQSEPGVYSLSVPTGGGKTFSSLRFALAHAKRNNMERIFYVIPFNTILDQNARDIRRALGNEADILAHYSNVVQESDRDETQYRQLTERWDSRIILTSMVHFLDTLFRRENSNARRMHQLSRSVLIFDEIQALPIHCKVLFQEAIKFLRRFCGCTVLLCTATQPRLPLLERDTVELVKDVGHLFNDLRRVNYVPQLSPRKSNDEAANDIAKLVSARQSTLTIVNTKAAAWHIYQAVARRLRAQGHKLFQPGTGITPEEAWRLANDTDATLCVHLSTSMCPAHRTDMLNLLKAWLKANKLVCCVSTALVEAGVNISFPVVIRSLAGIPNIIQAGGRCNRNWETDFGTVYLWDLYEENLTQLPEILFGKEKSWELLGNNPQPDWLATPEAVADFFKRYGNTSGLPDEKFSYEVWNDTLAELLSQNRRCAKAAEDRAVNPIKQMSKRLVQSFRTAGTAFKVINENTRAVLVPYGDGEALIQELCASHGISQETALLRRAQVYSVNLYPDVYGRLEQEQMLTPLIASSVVALKAGGYSAEGGIQTTPKELSSLIL